MTTVLQVCTTEKQRSDVRFFCGQKDSMQRIFIKKCLLFTVRSVCRVKLEEYTTEEQRSIVRFFGGAKELNAQDINKEMLPLYSGKCLSHKAVHNWCKMFR
jgi:hypothetical protein